MEWLDEPAYSARRRIYFINKNVNLSLTNHINNDINVGYTLLHICRVGKSKSTCFVEANNLWIDVCFSSVLIGDSLVQVDINTEVGVVRYRMLRELHIYTDYGRCSRPLFIVEKQRLLIKKKDILQLQQSVCFE